MNDPSESPCPVTFAVAVEIDPYTLAERWADRSLWGPLAEFGESGPLAELACMAALRAWLTRWLPLQIHVALMAEATVAQVCAACNLTVEEIRVAWERWAWGQRDLARRSDHLGLTEADYQRIEVVLAEAEAGGRR